MNKTNENSTGARDKTTDRVAFQLVKSERSHLLS